MADSLGSEVAERSAADYYRYSGGNPLALRALIQEWSSTRFTDEAGPETARGGTLAPGKVSALAVFTSLHRSGPQAMAVARGMALLGPAAGLDLLCQLLRSTPEDVTRHLQDLEAAGVLDGFRFRHPGVAQVLLTDPDFHDLRELHLAAAALLDADGHSALRVARHLIAADIVAEPWTVAVLRESAREAAGHNDWDFALKCLRLALRGALTDEERGLVVSEFLRVGWRQNPARVTKHFQECFELQQKGHVPDAETLTLLTIFLWHGHVEDAVTMLLDVADRCADGPLRTEIQTFLDWARLSHPGLLDRIRRADEQLLNRLLETSSDSLRPLTSLSLALCETGHTNVPATAQEVLADRRLTGDTAGSVLQSLLYAGELVTAERWAARAVQDAEQLATPLARGVHQAVCAEIARRRGDLPAAQQLAERALTHMAPRAWGVALGLPLSVLVAVHTARGHTERAGEHLSWSVHPEMYQTLYGLHYLQARGRHHLAVGQYAAALRDFRSCEDRVRAWGLAPPVLAPLAAGPGRGRPRPRRPERGPPPDRERAEPGPRPSSPRTRRAPARVRATGGPQPPPRSAHRCGRAGRRRTRPLRALPDPHRPQPRPPGGRRHREGTGHRSAGLAQRRALRRRAPGPDPAAGERRHRRRGDPGDAPASG